MILLHVVTNIYTNQMNNATNKRLTETSMVFQHKRSSSTTLNKQKFKMFIFDDLET